MKDLKSHLRALSEPIPDWLRNYQPGQPFSRQAFFQSRLVYYPGAGGDGHAVRLFGGSHCCHCFVYVDYGVSRAELVREIDDPQLGFRGYRSLARLEPSERDIVPEGWTPHVHRSELRSYPVRFASVTPYALLEILQREKGYDDTHGPERLAVLFLGADGIASYDALFCQSSSTGPPFAMLLQDHGFGGNYDRFGAGGALELIAQRTGVYPNYLLVAADTAVWQGYEPVVDVSADVGGCWANARRLYRWNGVKARTHPDERSYRGRFLGGIAPYP